MKELDDLLAALEAVRFDLLADWFDAKYPEGETEVQDDLRAVGKAHRAFKAVEPPLVLPQLSTQQLLEAFPCKKCGATGYLDDAEPGDIYSNQWDCEDCKGKGYRLPEGK